MRSPIKIIYFALPLLVYFVAASGVAAAFLPQDKTLIQLLIFPLVIFAVSKLKFADKKLPSFVLCSAFIGAVLGTVYTFNYPTLGKRGGILVARLQNDQMQTETRIFRESINSFFQKQSALDIQSLHETFSSSREVQEFLVKNRHINMLVWGNKRWINISFKQQPPKKLSELGPKWKADLFPELELITSIPVIGMSFEPHRDTAAFLADLAEGSYSKLFAQQSNLAELSLLHAAIRQATWTSFAPRSYAWWLLGNLYFEQAMREDGMGRRKTLCAIQAYSKALIFLRNADNPELQAAIYNNLALVGVVKAFFDGKPKLLKLAVHDLIQAKNTLRQKNLFGIAYTSGLIANENLFQLTGYHIIAASKSKLVKKKHKKKAAGLNKKRAKPQQGGKNMRAKRGRQQAIHR